MMNRLVVSGMMLTMLMCPQVLLILLPVGIRIRGVTVVVMVSVMAGAVVAIHID